MKTEKILNSPLDKLCTRCYDIIHWKITYRKYKPLKALAGCNICKQKCVIKAYRTICDPCAVSKNEEGTEQKLCTKCGRDTLIASEEHGEDGKGYAVFNPSRKAIKEERGRLEGEMDDVLRKLRERCKRTVLRKIETGEVTYDQGRKMFIYKETAEEYKVEQKDEEESDSEEEGSEQEEGAHAAIGMIQSGVPEAAEERP